MIHQVEVEEAEGHPGMMEEAQEEEEEKVVAGQEEEVVEEARVAVMEMAVLVEAEGMGGEVMAVVHLLARSRGQVQGLALEVARGGVGAMAEGRGRRRMMERTTSSGMLRPPERERVRERLLFGVGGTVIAERALDPVRDLEACTGSLTSS